MWWWVGTLYSDHRSEFWLKVKQTITDLKPHFCATHVILPSLFLPCDERWSGVHIEQTCSLDHLNAVTACYRAVCDQLFSHIIYSTRMFEVSGKETPTVTTHFWLSEISNLMSCTLLSQAVGGLTWLITCCMTWIFLHFKAYSEGLYNQECALDWPKTAAVHVGR